MANFGYDYPSILQDLYNLENNHSDLTYPGFAGDHSGYTPSLYDNGLLNCNIATWDSDVQSRIPEYPAGQILKHESPRYNLSKTTGCTTEGILPCSYHLPYNNSSFCSTIARSNDECGDSPRCPLSNSNGLSNLEHCPSYQAVYNDFDYASRRYSSIFNHDPLLNSSSIDYLKNSSENNEILRNSGGAIDSSTAPMVYAVPFQTYDGYVYTVPATRFAVPQEAMTPEDCFQSADSPRPRFNSILKTQAQIPDYDAVQPIEHQTSFADKPESLFSQVNAYSATLVRNEEEKREFSNESNDLTLCEWQNLSNSTITSTEFRSSECQELDARQESSNIFRQKTSDNIRLKENIPLACPGLANPRKRKAPREVEISGKCQHQLARDSPELKKQRINASSGTDQLDSTECSQVRYETSENKSGPHTSKINPLKIVQVCSIKEAFLKATPGCTDIVCNVPALRKTLANVIEGVKNKTVYFQRLDPSNASAKSLFINHLIHRLLLPKNFQLHQFQYHILHSVFNLLNSSHLRKDCFIYEYGLSFGTHSKSEVLNIINQFMTILLRKVAKYCVMLAGIRQSKLVDEKIFKLFVFAHKQEGSVLIDNCSKVDKDKFKTVIDEKYFPKLEKIEEESYFAWVDEVIEDSKNHKELMEKIVTNKDSVLKAAVLCNMKFSEKYLVEVQKLLILYQVLIAKNLLKYYYEKLHYDFQEKRQVNVRPQAVLWAIGELNLRFYDDELRKFKI